MRKENRTTIFKIRIFLSRQQQNIESTYIVFIYLKQFELFFEILFIEYSKKNNINEFIALKLAISKFVYIHCERTS